MVDATVESQRHKSLLGLAMNLEEYCGCDATELAKLVREGQVTAKELAEIVASNVAAVDPQVNGVIEMYADRIGSLNESLIPDGPFRGVPFFLKDLGPRQKGRAQDGGSRLTAGYVADYSSFMTEKMEQAGLNIMGRTTCPEFGITGTTESILTGATCNPWDTGKTTGGSSGGSAAIVAAGVLPMAHSNDGGGSTRIPASICGNVGMKHSRGRISYAPEGCDISYPLFSDGVNAKSVRDVAGFLDAVQGPAPGEPIIFSEAEQPFVDEVDRDPGKLRIAVCADQFGARKLDADMAVEINTVAKMCEDAGHHVEIAAPAIDYEIYLSVFRRIWCIDLAVMLDYEASNMKRAVSADTVEPITLKIWEAGRNASAAERLGITHAMSMLGRQLGAFFEDYDLLLTPVMGRPTPELGSPFNLLHEDQSLDEWFENALDFIPITPLNNMTGTPAVSLPLCRDSNGMPAGAHFMAPMGRENRLFNISGQLERISPWQEKRPPLHVLSV